MQNFNTNQTRQLYVAGAVNEDVANNLDISLGQAATGEFFLKYKNADGLITRSDTFDPKKIVALHKATAANLTKDIRAHVITLDTTAVSLSEIAGKVLDCIITIHDAFDYDSSVNFVASVVGAATITEFYKALAIAIAKAVPRFDAGYPAVKVFSSGTEVTAATAADKVTGSTNGVVLVEAPQKYVRGKLSGEPCHISVAFRLKEGNYEDIVWGKDTVDTVSAINTAQTTSIAPAKISGTYALADLEYFAAGEKGDFYRGSNWPNDYPFTPAVDLSKEYDILTVEYYWSGNAEGVQKSPRMIQVASATSTVITTLYESIEKAM